MGYHIEIKEEFPGLEISKSALHRFMKNVCALSMKRLEKIPGKRNDPDTIENRKTTVESWIATTDMDFEKNCVFLDEADFNLNITRNRGWSKKDKPAKTIVLSARGISIYWELFNLAFRSRVESKTTG
ncbi:hypothetical protein [Parasitella parasitica]|uniref:Tc1-like transposase DDE domain-containing protein n=1 Tax=Parasitella parasitica TaxID=35722 RepID=A0A0B7N8P0_9FUNG|nr:hypothetical protein [Parasitella parasitica]